MGETASQPLRLSFDAVRRTTNRAALLRWLAIGMLPCFGILAVAAHLVRLAKTEPVNPADLAGLLLSAEDMVRGNWLLHGWILGSDSLWLTDGLVYAAGFALRGLDPVLLHVVPTVVSIALVGAVVAAATAGRKGPAVSFAAVLAILPIVFPSSLMVEVLLGPYHTAAMVVALLSTVAQYYAQERFDRPRQVWTVTGFAFVLLTAGTLSDPYTVVLALVPIALVSLARTLVARPEERGRRLLPLLAAAAAWYGAPAVASWVRDLGGAYIIPFVPTTVPYSKIGDGVANLVLALLRLGGGDIFGRVIDGSLASAVLRLAYLAAGFAATWLALRDEIGLIRGNRSQGDWLTTVLATSAAVCLIGNVLSTSDLNARYRLPLLVMSGVVLARRFGAVSCSWIARRQVLAAAVGIAVILCYVGPWRPYLHPAVHRGPDADVVLGRWLEAHDLEYGFGGYWEASNVTVATHGAVKVRPVVSTKVHQPGLGPSGLPPSNWRLTRIRVSSKDTWYQSEPARFFVVFDPASQWDRDTGVDFDVATRTFGPPHHVYQVDRFRVLVWD
jgi:hypothetical protein